MGDPQIIAALYVLPNGPYAGLPDVELWDEARDARLYEGPWPVVAHPPCARWGRYWYGGPLAASKGMRRALGDDGGCFAAALAAVRQWGGVLEHPADSHAWAAHGLNRPPRSGGWVNADHLGGWTCHVEQGHYGHRARKPTWLYAFGIPELPSLTWGPSGATARWSIELRDGHGEKRPPEVLSHRERAVTPGAFRDLLIGIARSARETAHA